MQQHRSVRRPAALAGASLLLLGCTNGAPTSSASVPDGRPAASSPSRPPVALPSPAPGADAALGHLLHQRRSTREFADQAVALQTAATMLWAAYGRQADGGRTVPSAGGRYPMTMYLVVGQVAGLTPGVYAYRPGEHQLVAHLDRDVRRELAAAALNQEPVAAAPVVLVVAGAPDRLRDRYADRSERFVMMEAGHIGQNLALIAPAVDLGLVTIGAFDDAAVAEVLALPESEHAYYLIPVGHPTKPGSTVTT